MNKFWEFKALGNAGELFLYGEISASSWWGDEVTPAQFRKDLAALGDIASLNVHINSPGGDAFAGFSIYTILSRLAAEKTVYIDGIAASAASIIAMAGNRIVMPECATLMIHNAWTDTAGNAGELRKIADELERIDGQLAGVYAARTGGTVEDMKALMDAETWMSGAEAKEKGFCDEIEENVKAAACVSPEIMARYKHAPEIEPDDRDVSQPVEDKANIEAQKRRFELNNKKKIMMED